MINPPVGSTAEVVLPDGSSRFLEAATATFKDTQLPGVYRVRYIDASGEAEIAVTAVRNFAPEESGVLPRALLIQPPTEVEAEETSLVQEWAPWVISIVLILMAVEWWVGHQRPGLRTRREFAV